GTCPITGASRSRAPRSASIITAVAVTILVIENHRKVVCAETGRRVRTSARPLMTISAAPSVDTTAAARPGGACLAAASPTGAAANIASPPPSAPLTADLHLLKRRGSQRQAPADRAAARDGPRRAARRPSARHGNRGAPGPPRVQRPADLCACA